MLFWCGKNHIKLDIPRSVSATIFSLSYCTSIMCCHTDFRVLQWTVKNSHIPERSVEHRIAYTGDCFCEYQSRAELLSDTTDGLLNSEGSLRTWRIRTRVKYNEGGKEKKLFLKIRFNEVSNRWKLLFYGNWRAIPRWDRGIGLYSQMVATNSMCYRNGKLSISGICPESRKLQESFEWRTSRKLKRQTGIM